jgi:hypothetical protein
MLASVTFLAGAEGMVASALGRANRRGAQAGVTAPPEELRAGTKAQGTAPRLDYMQNATCHLNVNEANIGWTSLNQNTSNRLSGASAATWTVTPSITASTKRIRCPTTVR